jgi:hypothetical protein
MSSTPTGGPSGSAVCGVPGDASWARAALGGVAAFLARATGPLAAMAAAAVAALADVGEGVGGTATVGLPAADGLGGGGLAAGAAGAGLAALAGSDARPCAGARPVPPGEGAAGAGGGLGLDDAGAGGGALLAMVRYTPTHQHALIGLARHAQRTSSLSLRPAKARLRSRELLGYGLCQNLPNLERQLQMARTANGAAMAATPAADGPSWAAELTAAVSEGTRALVASWENVGYPAALRTQAMEVGRGQRGTVSIGVGWALTVPHALCTFSART